LKKKYNAKRMSLLITDKRTGIYVTDEMQIIASGRQPVASSTAIPLKDYFAKEKVETVPIGGKQMNGLPSENC
jgi:putative Holliday junction resolvase